MFGKYPVAEVAGLFADPVRVAMLIHLLDGSSRPAGELARAGGVSAQAASAHLNKLREGGLLQVWQQGRHRYFRLTSADVSATLEALAAHARLPLPVAATARDREAASLRYSRTCYDHVAGELAVGLAETWHSRGFLDVQDREFALTPEGEHWLVAQGLDLSRTRMGRRSFARRCLDWTERRHHIGGALGAAILEHWLSRGWVARRKGTRALRTTSVGKEHLARVWGLNP